MCLLGHLFATPPSLKIPCGQVVCTVSLYGSSALLKTWGLWSCSGRGGRGVGSIPKPKPKPNRRSWLCSPSHCQICGNTSPPRHRRNSPFVSQIPAQGSVCLVFRKETFSTCVKSLGVTCASPQRLKYISILKKMYSSKHPIAVIGG